MPSEPQETKTYPTLSQRGNVLASGFNMREIAGTIMGPKWHRETNPDAVVNIGTAENVRA